MLFKKYKRNTLREDRPSVFDLVKGKGRPRTGHKGLEGEQWYSCTLSVTSTPDGGGQSTSRPGRFTDGEETWYLLYTPVWTGVQNLPPPPTGIRSTDRPARRKSL